MEGQFKRTLCKFFLEGTCTKGASCTWSHAEDDGRRGGPPPQVPPQEKKTICKFWLEGTCKSGDNCTWAHGEHELGQALPGMKGIVSRAKGEDLPHKNGGGKGLPHKNGFGKGVFSSVAYGLSPIPLQPIGLAGSQKGGLPKGAPGSGPPKRSMCKFWLEGKCREGDRCTWAHGEEDIGNAETELHPWSKPVAFAPPIGGRPHQTPQGQQARQPPPVKRTMCKFWMEGRCQAGDKCTWAHGEEDVGVVSSDNELDSYPQLLERTLDELDMTLEDAELEELLAEGLTEEDVAGIMGPMLSEERAPGPGVAKTKRTICKFWLEGRCREGDNCTYAHGDEEVGSVVITEEREEPRFAGTVGKQEMKRTQCKFWLEGRCQNGDRCTWAHGEEEVGVVVPSEAVIDRPPPWKGIGKKGKESPVGAGAWKGGGKGPIGAGPAPLARASDAPEWMGPNAKRTICKFWQQGRCAEGERCTYAHGELEMQSGGGGSTSSGKGMTGGFLFPTLLASPRSDAFEKQPQEEIHRPGIKRSLCKFWLDNACTKGDECTFAHGEEDIGEPIPGDLPGSRPPPMHGSLPPINTPCKFFAMGTCTKGDTCAYAHLEASEDEQQVKRQRLR